MQYCYDENGMRNCDELGIHGEPVTCHGLSAHYLDSYTFVAALELGHIQLDDHKSSRMNRRMKRAKHRIDCC